MREYQDRHDIENIYEKARNNIKKTIEAKNVSMKGSTKGAALSEIIAVIDREMEIGIAEELVTATRLIREYYKKYAVVSHLDREIYEKKQELEKQEKMVGLISHLTDETLKNAIIAYNCIKDTSRDSHNAKEIALAYINAKGRSDLNDVIESRAEE